MQLTLHIFGKVQNVWYRASTRGVALDLGLKGFARNEKAGEVTIVAIGSQKNLTKLKKWCEHGPSGAKIKKIKEKWDETEETFDDFSIL